MVETFNSPEGAVFSAPASPAVSFVEVASGPQSFAPVTAQAFDATPVAAPATTLDLGTPIAGYDRSATPVKDSTPSVPASDMGAFKSDAQVKYQASDKVPAVASDRTRIGADESPKINVGPINPSKQADILIGKDGAVHVAKGLTDTGKPLKEYNVQVEAGVDSKVTEKVLSDLGEHIKSQAPDVVPRITSQKDGDGKDIVSSDFKDSFREKFNKGGNPDEKLPDDPSMPPGGGGGGGGGGGCDGGNTPKPDANVDNESDNGKDGKDSRDGRDSSISGGAFRDLSGKLSDMNPVQYNSWLSNVMPDDFAAEMGPPPWDAKKLAAYMSKHSKEIKDRMGKRAASLDKEGDKDGAKAINDFADNFDKMANDPSKMEQFAGTMSSFAERASNGVANTGDVHAMFDKNSALEQAIRNSQLVETAKKYDHSQPDGRADFSKINGDNAARLVAELQKAPPPKIVDGRIKPNPLFGLD